MAGSLVFGDAAAGAEGAERRRAKARALVRPLGLQRGLFPLTAALALRERENRWAARWYRERFLSIRGE